MTEPLSRPLSTPPAPPPRLFVVGGGPFQLDLVRTAKALGAIVAVADRDPEAPGLAIADHPLAIDIVDLEAMVRAAEDFAADGVVTAASDVALPAVAAIAKARRSPALAVEAVARCRDKLETFRCLEGAGLAVPETRLVEGAAEAADAAEALGAYPVVIKPRSAAGGRGVSVVRDRSGLRPAFERAAGYGAQVLVQRFVTGHAVGVEAFFHDGALRAAFVMDDQFVPGFVSPVGHSLPSELSEEAQARIRDDVGAFAAALGLREGPANFDLRVERGRTVLLEVNARLGGNSITDLVRAAYGVDLSAATVRASLGHDPVEELRPREVTACASRLVVFAGRGIARVSDPRAALGDAADLVSVEVAARDGEPLALLVDEHAIVGRCVVRGKDPVAAVRRATEVGEILRRAVAVE